MILLVRGSRNWNNKTRDNSLTRKVSSSLGSLTVLSFNAVLPFIIRFLTCSSDGDVELVDSTVTWTAGLVRVFVCPGFFDTGTHWLLLALGESCTFFFLSGCSVDSESADRLISNENINIMWYVLALFNMRLNSKPFYYLFFFWLWMEDFLVKVIGDSVSFSFPPFKGTLYTCSLQHSGALREKAAYNYLFCVYLCMYTSKLVLAHLQQPP